ncbi:hypothetical protein JOM56_008643 [Amanita muscaria]
MSLAHLVNPNDLQQILVDALTSFSPLAALVGANSARALSNHTSNSKQVWAASLAPIGALGMMSTVCKGSTLSALKDLLGAGETDILDACAELGCGTIYGVVPRFSKRGGLTCEAKTRNPGIGACAILRARWTLPKPRDKKTDKEADGLDMEELSKFLTTIHMSTLSGRLVWECQHLEEQNDIANRIQRLLLQSWSANESAWTTDLLTIFQETTDPKIRNATAGMIELHWPAPSMPLETHAGAVFLFIAVFTILPTTIIIIAATPLTNWKTPAASALLFGGQAVLSTGHFLAQWVIKRQRNTVHLVIPRQNLSSSWMLVDNTWFTNTLARRRLLHNPLSPHTVTIGQHLNMKDHIPTREALITLVTIAIGFLAFYIGSRSSHLWVILFEIVFFFIANLCKGFVMTTANEAYVTLLNNPGFVDVVTPLVEKPALRKRILAALSPLLSSLRPKRPNQDVELQDLNLSTPFPDGKQKVHTGLDPSTLPLPQSTSTFSLAGSSKSGSSFIQLPPAPHSESDTPPTSSSRLLIDLPLTQEPSPEPHEPTTQDPTSTNDLLIPVATTPGTSTPSSPSQPTDPAAATLRIPRQDSHQLTTTTHTSNAYRVYTKIASRSHDSIGLFYFGSPQSWGAAAHVVYEALHDRIQWAPHMRREAVLVFPFGYFGEVISEKEKEVKPGNVVHPSSSSTKSSTSKGKGKETSTTPDRPIAINKVRKQIYIESFLILALDETRNEDMFWTAGVEFMSVLIGAGDEASSAFTDIDRLVSEYPESTDANRLFGSFVFFVTRLILLACTANDANYDSEAPPEAGAATSTYNNFNNLNNHHFDPGMAGPVSSDSYYPGVASMMRAIDLVMRKYPFDSSVHTVPMMRDHARAAVHSVLGQ